MTAFAGGSIECFAGPQEKGAPDDLEQVIVDFIDGARRELQVAVQELDNEPIARALVRARLDRRVDVEVFLEQDYLVEAWSAADLDRMRLPGESDADAHERLVWGDADLPLNANRRLLGALQRAKIDVKADLNPAIFHQKFIVRDVRGGAGTDPALLTGSANFTDTDAHANLNHAVVFHDQRIAQEYFSQFNQMREGDFGRGALSALPPRDYLLDGVPVRILFSPDNVPELELVKQMLKLRKLDGRLHFAIFTFSSTSAVDDALSMLARAGVNVRGVLDRGQNRSRPWSGAWRLHEPRIELFLPKSSWRLRKVHHKLMVIDEATVAAGSFNYTADANDFNDENLFVVGSPDPQIDGKPVDAAECARITGFFRDEIERIITHCDPWTPPDPPG
ncbi:MAG: phospholipase D-like domain-containing protein [Solirubrobacteraceae bacterium]